MKNTILYLLTFFLALSLNAQEPAVKFYMNDGSFKSYNISDIGNMTFKALNPDTKLILFLHDTIRPSLSVTDIDSISFGEDNLKNKILRINQKGNILSYEVSRIDSIIFSTLSHVIAKIDTLQFGDTKDFVLKSAYQDSASLFVDEFATKVSNEGTQLLFVFDKQEQLRGYTLSTLKNGEPSILKIDAKSTAYSLLMMTPGILTTEPKETEIALSNFANLKNINPLIEYLKLNLANKTLSTILDEDELNTLLDSCVFEYKTKPLWTKVHRFNNE